MLIYFKACERHFIPKHKNTHKSAFFSILQEVHFQESKSLKFSQYFLVMSFLDAFALTLKNGYESKETAFLWTIIGIQLYFQDMHYSSF